MVAAKNDVLSPDFLDFITCLNGNRVDYVLVGGYALAIHGVLRATGDIDFLYRRTELNVWRLCHALEEFGAPPAAVDEKALRMPNCVTQLGRPPYRIDLLSSIDGVTFGEVWKGAKRTTIRGEELRVIGAAELLANKSATGRAKDAEDVRRLTRSARKRI